jgi:hypothetical protein
LKGSDIGHVCLMQEVFVRQGNGMSLLYLSFSGGQHDLILEPLGLQME